MRRASSAAVGRSGGYVTVLATQKPTGESIPTKIRYLAELRVCYSVMNRNGAEATLGDGWAEEGLSPVKEQHQGMAVCYSDAHGFKRVQSPFIAPPKILNYATQFADLCDDPRRSRGQVSDNISDDVPPDSED